MLTLFFSSFVRALFIEYNRMSSPLRQEPIHPSEGNVSRDFAWFDISPVSPDLLCESVGFDWSLYSQGHSGSGNKWFGVIDSNASSSSYWIRASPGSWSIWYIRAKDSFTRYNCLNSNWGVPRNESNRRISESYRNKRCWNDCIMPSRNFDNRSLTTLLEWGSFDDIAGVFSLPRWRNIVRSFERSE